MQLLLERFSLMKEVVMCNKNLKLKVYSRSTDNYSLLKHRNFDFAFFEEGAGGGDTYLKSNL